MATEKPQKADESRNRTSLVKKYSQTVQSLGNLSKADLRKQLENNYMKRLETLSNKSEVESVKKSHRHKRKELRGRDKESAPDKEIA